MKIYKVAGGIVISHLNDLFLFKQFDWDQLINRNNLYDYLVELLHSRSGQLINSLPEEILPPIGSQEIWAAGVTYLRSREARMDEAKESGASVFYSKVYEAKRPELFFKSTASRAVGHRGTVHIRKDARWNVPEPELTLLANSYAQIVGYTIGNDMSSRDIEGENPLYLPQAKCYDHAAAIGPCLYVPQTPINSSTIISMQIMRDGKELFSGQININQMKRSHQELVDYLFLELSFPNAVYLMTGTCLVPPNDFTLQVNDVVNIEIQGIGILTNKVGTRA